MDTSLWVETPRAPMVALLFYDNRATKAVLRDEARDEGEGEEIVHFFFLPLFRKHHVCFTFSYLCCLALFASFLLLSYNGVDGRRRKGTPTLAAGHCTVSRRIAGWGRM